MKYQFIVWLGLSLLLSIPLRAQNSIDRMVEEYSAIGGSKFTSAVERDPNTSRVKKVVKRLVVNVSKGGLSTDSSARRNGIDTR